jgi:hypothetical protein
LNIPREETLGRPRRKQENITKKNLIVNYIDGNWNEMAKIQTNARLYGGKASGSREV